MAPVVTLESVSGGRGRGGDYPASSFSTSTLVLLRPLADVSRHLHPGYSASTDVLPNPGLQMQIEFGVI